MTASSAPPGANGSVDPEQLRTVMRTWATGVTLVTSHDRGRPHGMTVTSFTSVSLQPPLVLVSLERTTRTRQMVMGSRCLAVAVLAEDQMDLADRFAGRVADSDDRFVGVPYRALPSGSPLPEGCLAYLDCRVAETHEVATHSLVVAKVTAAEILRQAAPLLYHERGYRSLDRP